MPQKIKTVADYELDIAAIDEDLNECRSRMDELIAKRRKIAAKLREQDIAAAIESIEELGVPISEVLELINKEISKRETKGK